MSCQELLTPDELNVKLLDEYQARKRYKDKNSEAMVASKSLNFARNKNENKPFNRNNKSRFKYKCHKRGKIGHMAKDCRTRQSDNNRKQEAKELSKKAEVDMKNEIVMEVTVSDENNWCPDLIRKFF